MRYLRDLQKVQKKEEPKENGEKSGIPEDLEFDDSRRSKIQILVDIIKIIQKKGGYAKPTHILYGANLSHIRLMKYLNWLQMRGMIEQVDFGGRAAYKVTPKGLDFVKEFRKVQNFSEAFGIPI